MIKKRRGGGPVARAGAVTMANLEKCPSDVRELLRRNGDVIANAARAAGLGEALLRIIARGGSYTEVSRAQVAAALEGRVVAPVRKGKHSIHNVASAILISKTERFEMLYDLAITLGGKWKFKRNAGKAHWLGVLSIPAHRLAAYRTFVEAEGQELVEA